MKKLFESMCREIALSDDSYKVIVTFDIGFDLDSIKEGVVYLTYLEDFIENYSNKYKSVVTVPDLTDSAVKTLSLEDLYVSEDDVYTHESSQDVLIISAHDSIKFKEIIKHFVFLNIPTCAIIGVRDNSGIVYEYKLVDCRFATSRFIDSDKFMQITPFYGDGNNNDSIKTSCIGSRYIQNVIVPEDVKYVIDKIVKEKDYESAATCITSVTCDILRDKATESIKKYVRDELGDTAGNICDMLLNFKK